MKKFPFAILLLAVSVSSSVAGENLLERSAAALATDRKLIIGYIGGSLTEGAGASDKEKTSWRVLTTQWFRKKFPEAKITEIDASIGGTGSDLGVYRLGVDLLERKPDLVFVEFGVNDDSVSRQGPGAVVPAMEGIVRQIWQANPRADIVFVYTTKHDYEEYLIRGESPPSIIQHKTVAAHYGIPEVDVGSALWQSMKASGSDWKELMPDMVHPNDTGYAIYARAMADFLEAQDWGQTSKEPVVMPAKLNAGALENARFVDAREAAAPGWKTLPRMVGLRPSCIASDEPGKEIAFRFAGDAVGVFWLSADDAGDIEWSVDGAPFQRHTSWTPYGGINGRGFSEMLCKPGSLSPGKHELKIRVAKEKHEKSTGNWIRIAAFLVNPPAK